MTDDARDNGATGAAGDPLDALLLGFAAQIDQLAALIGGTSGGSAGDGAGARVAELAGEVGNLLGELSDLLARLLAAFIAVLEAIAAMLKQTPTTAPTPTSARFESIPVRIAAPTTHP